MTGWARPEIISALALGVSVLSLSMSLFMAWRTAAAERPVAWVKLEPTEKADCWLVKIHLRNRSNLDLRALSVWVPVRAVPITKKQDFWMLEYSKGLRTAADGRRVLLENFENLEREFKVMLQPSAPVRPGDTGIFHVILFRSALSDAALVKMTLCIEVMKPRPRIMNFSLVGQIPSEMVRIHIASV